MIDLELLAERGAMAASIAHELNNYLGMILGGVQLTQIAVARANMERAAQCLDRLCECAAQMERFTAGLMDRGRLDTRREETDLNAVITDVISFATAQRRFKRIKFDLRIEADLPKCEIDREQITQVLLNLINNAADAITETGRTDGRISVETAADADAVTMTVADNGPGMTPEVQAKLFREQLTTKPTGHGYGLVTCAAIIANHQGTVDVRSAPGHGTAMTIRIPQRITGPAQS
jgi:signal transduction histidine kinase